MEAEEWKTENGERKTEDRKTGTKEWAEATVNIQLGCEHDCRYCYARHDAVSRFHSCSREAWRSPVIDAEKVDRNYGKYRGWVMFPSAHDVTQRNLAECLVVLHKLLDAGNQVLIVSKPSVDVMAVLIEALKKYQSRAAFRFTIGSSFDNILKFWEPGAPRFEERIKSLSMAYFMGYCTSVSCEPFLDVHPAHIRLLYEQCSEYMSCHPPDHPMAPVCGFWIGKLRHFVSRVDLSGATDQEIKLYVDPLRKAQGDAFVRGLVRELDGRRNIRWKDSIREVIEKKLQDEKWPRKSTRSAEKGTVDA